MATYWTIKVGATEKSLRNWGVISDFSVRRENKQKATLTLRTVERFDPGATQWSGPTIVSGLPVHTKATVYRDRTSANEATNSFSGGSIYFVGYFDDPRRVAGAGEENVEYAIHNVLWLFERNPFAQYYYQFTGFDATHTRAVAMQVANGGTGYPLGAQFTVVGGVGTACTGIVIATDTGTGEALLVAIANAGGSYTTFPTNPCTTSGGTGTGLTVNLTSGLALNLQQVVASEVYLGENVQQGYVLNWDNGQQIQEIMNWMNITYNPTRHPNFPGYPGTIDATQDVVTLGTIDPKTYLPTTRQNTITCLTALNVVLQADTDAVIVEDPTTTIPTVHVRKLAKWNYATTPPTFVDYTNLTEVTVNITTDQEQEVIAQSQLSKVLPGVIIYYKWATVVDNVSTPFLAVDKADVNGSALYVNGVKMYGSGSPTIDDWTPEVSRHTFDLIGGTSGTTTATVTGEPIADIVADVDGWWRRHDKSLRAPEVPVGTITSAGTAEIVDENGTAVDTTVYAYELQRNCPTWLGPSIRAIVRQPLNYIRYKSGYPSVPTNRAGDGTSGRIHTYHILLSSVPPGTYNTLSSITSGEAIPFGVAEAAYRSAAAQQYQGHITLYRNQLRSDLTGLGTGPNNVGFRLKLIGPNTTFSNLLVQAIDDYPHEGRTVVTYGATPPVDVDQWVTLSRASRVRWSWTLPSGRGDGSGSGSRGGGGGSGDSENALDNSAQMLGGTGGGYQTHTHVA